MLLLAGCTQDEAPDASVNPLPPDTYPLQIASVTVAAEADGTQPQTRITDSGDASSWQDGDEIAVSMGGQTAVYSYNSTEGTWTSNAPLCWESTEPQTVNAWYPVADEIDFTHQDQGLTYLLKADAVPATYNDPQPLNLTFRHQLAKVRVLLDGKKATEVASVTVRNYPQSANNQGALGSSIGDPVYVPMLKTTYESKPCWEATLRPGSFEADNTFEVAKEGGSPVRVTLAKDKIPVTAGQVTMITINVEQAPTEIDLSTYEGPTLAVSGKTILKGDGQQKNLQITIKADAEVTLEDVVLAPTATGNAITCKGNATIILTGSSSLTAKTESSNYPYHYGSGIYVESGTLTIDGEGSLIISRTSTNTRNFSVGAGIGAGSGANILIKSGNISIGDVPDDSSTSGAGIGSTPEENCGDITIKGGTIRIGKPYWYSACIGSAEYRSCGDITISGESTVITFTKGLHAPWGIGNGDDGTCGTVTITGGATVNGVEYYDHTEPL